MDATTEWKKDLNIPSAGGGDGGGRNLGDRNLCRPPPEYCCTIYCDKAIYGPVSGVDAVARGVYFEAVVVAG